MHDAPPHTLIIGCGNLLRSDDGVGPAVVRHLRERASSGSFGDGVQVIDGGTSGMNVAFRMRGVTDVILIDACVSGAEAGTIIELTAAEVAAQSPDPVTNHHGFRWDHAVGLSQWLLADDAPASISAILIEAASTAPGMELTPAVEAAMQRVVDRLAVCLADRAAAVGGS